MQAVTLDMECHVAEDREGWLLKELNIICREKSEVTIATSTPPALIHHLNFSDDIIWIKRNLIASLCGGNW